MTITLERMRADIAALVHLEPEEIGLDDNLMDLGLDSMRLLNLIMMWEQAGVDLDFGTFAERFTLAAWWEAIEARQGGRGEADVEAADGAR